MTYSLVFDPFRNGPSTTMVRRDSDGAFIPFDDGNRDYQAYKIWLEEGNQPNALPRTPKENDDE